MATGSDNSKEFLVQKFGGNEKNWKRLSKTKNNDGEIVRVFQNAASKEQVSIVEDAKGVLRFDESPAPAARDISRVLRGYLEDNFLYDINYSDSFNDFLWHLDDFNEQNIYHGTDGDYVPPTLELADLHDLVVKDVFKISMAAEFKTIEEFRDKLIKLGFIVKNDVIICHDTEQSNASKTLKDLLDKKFGGRWECTSTSTCSGRITRRFCSNHTDTAIQTIEEEDGEFRILKEVDTLSFYLQAGFAQDILSSEDFDSFKDKLSFFNEQNVNYATTEDTTPKEITLEDLRHLDIKDIFKKSDKSSLSGSTLEEFTEQLKNVGFNVKEGIILCHGTLRALAKKTPKPTL